jgi:hypothetical protein
VVPGGYASHNEWRPGGELANAQLRSEERRKGHRSGSHPQFTLWPPTSRRRLVSLHANVPISLQPDTDKADPTAHGAGIPPFE